MRAPNLSLVGKMGLIAALGLSLTACDLIDDILNAIGMASEKVVRISGQTYFKLDRKDSKDGVSSQNGYLCVVHDPGCGIVGNDGEDTFFFSQQLPPLAEVVGFTFEPVPPAGLAASYNPGPSGSFDTTLQSGPTDGSQPIRIRWHNACWGPYGGKPAIYRVSMKVKIKGDLDLIDEKFDPDQQLPVPECRKAETPTPTTTCGISNVQVPMSRVSATADGVIYAGTTANGLNSTCVNVLQSISAAQVPYAIQLLKKGGEKCSDAAVRMGPGIKIETTEDDQTAVFGEAHPKHPIKLRACVEAGANPPEGFVLIATFKGS
jgi:hypothetical protein